MSPAQLNAYLCAVLTTALETEPAPFPESYAYIAIGADFSRWSTIRHVLATAQLCTFEGCNVQLTEKGRAMARQIEEHMKEARA